MAFLKAEQSMRIVLAFGTVALLTAGCGIFSPRDDFEPPIVTDLQVVDPFSFAELLSGTNQQFTRLDPYEELFHDNFEYVNEQLSTSRVEKTKMITYLRLQHELFSDVTVIWQGGTKDDAANAILLNNKSYSVVRNDTVLFEGTSRFEIIRGNDNIWQILKWNDSPRGEKSFFSPAGQ